MSNFLFKLTIFYNFLFATASIFVGLYQLDKYDRVWPLILIIAVAWPMCATQVIVLLHVMKAIPFVKQAECDTRMNSVRELYPVSKGLPFVAGSTKKATARTE